MGADPGSIARGGQNGPAVDTGRSPVTRTWTARPTAVARRYPVIPAAAPIDSQNARRIIAGLQPRPAGGPRPRRAGWSRAGWNRAGWNRAAGGWAPWGRTGWRWRVPPAR